MVKFQVVLRSAVKSTLPGYRRWVSPSHLNLCKIHRCLTVFPYLWIQDLMGYWQALSGSWAIPGISSFAVEKLQFWIIATVQPPKQLMEREFQTFQEMALVKVGNCHATFRYEKEDDWMLWGVDAFRGWVGGEKPGSCCQALVEIFYFLKLGDNWFALLGFSKAPTWKIPLLLPH